MGIWHVKNKTWTKLVLWRTGNNKNLFQVVCDGEPRALLTNYGSPGYIIIDKKYEELLKKIEGQVGIVPIAITDPETKITFENYIELKIKNHIDHKTIHFTESQGLEIWESMQTVFVSTDLKNEFQKISSDDFEFTEGFPPFA